MTKVSTLEIIKLKILESIFQKKKINLLKSENTYKEWENRTTATTKIKNKKTKNTNQSYGWLMM